MTALWTSEEAQGATLGTPGRAFEIGGLSIDTRTLKPGDMFVALKGDTRDGHDFVKAAFDAKAGAALVSREPPGLGHDAALLTVANTLRGLEDMARAARARSNAKIVAVTGSAGKTTTKEILRIAFGALGQTHASAESYNNHWGVPLSLASLPREAKYGIFEVGMNHFGEIRSLVSFVRPHVAMITTIAPAHLEYFGTCEAIADAKAEIFEGLVPGGAAIVPADSPYTDRLIARARLARIAHVLVFGRKAGSDARLLGLDENDDGSLVKADICGMPVEFRIGAPGAHIAGNAIAALLAVAMAEGDVLNAAASLKAFTALKGRGARISTGGVSIIDESYNANPASMLAALAVLTLVKGRRVVALGDMLELGVDSLAHHTALAGAIETARADLVFASGPQMRALWDALPISRRGGYAETAAELAPLVTAAVRAGDTVLVKGSNSSKMSLVVDALKMRSA
jgi:UDP-N-acetylmuramoyl-tripeptide--D-alanyl-D-alanine ligase